VFCCVVLCCVVLCCVVLCCVVLCCVVLCCVVLCCVALCCVVLCCVVLCCVVHLSIWTVNCTRHTVRTSHYTPVNTYSSPSTHLITLYYISTLHKCVATVIFRTKGQQQKFGNQNCRLDLGSD